LLYIRVLKKKMPYIQMGSHKVCFGVDDENRSFSLLHDHPSHSVRKRLYSLSKDEIKDTN
jgi:hypothetical protein